ncbi:DUF982 domain-containing protein [Paracoccus litorisediminis]|uniref:DUF982 domain-containing protein n=1 Tax=Paracoccus litorisediminis TaxID=2006130 RepID=UPI003733D5B8
MTAAGIRPVSFEERPATYRIVNDAAGMGRALLTHCEFDHPTCRVAAEAVLALQKGEMDPEVARKAFVAALTAAGVFVRGES